MRSLTALALVMCAFAVQVSSGVNYVLVPLRMVSQNYSESFIGLAMSFEILAAIVLFKKLSDLVNRLGVVRLVIITSVVRAGIIYSYNWIDHTALWLMAILCYGLATCLLLIVIQIWLNNITQGKAKGIFLGLYSSGLSLGVASAPLLLVIFKEYIAEEKSFLLGSLAALSVLALMSPFLSRSPNMDDATEVKVRYVVGNAKLIMFAALTGGVCFYGLPTFLTIYGVSNNLDEIQASYLMTAFMFGSVCLGLLGSSLSGFFNRYLMIVVLMGMSALCAVFLSLMVYASYYHTLGLLFIWGGCMGSVYAIGIALVGDEFGQHDQVQANATYVLMDSIGGLVGLCAIGSAMHLFNAEGMSYTIAIVCTVYLTSSLVGLMPARDNSMTYKFNYSLWNRLNL